MNRKTIIWIVAVVVIGGVAFALFTPTPAVNKRINSQELSQLQGAGAWLVDVRTNAEYVAGHIPNSLSTPIDQLEQVAASWSKTQPIIVYGGTGEQSLQAAALLATAGFKKIYSLDGGAATWTGPVAGGQPPTTAPRGPGIVKTSGKPVFVDFAGSA